jgi:hypothetical protein
MVLACDGCGVQTTAWTDGHWWPVGWLTDMSEGGFAKHWCPECAICGPVDPARRERGQA